MATAPRRRRRNGQLRFAFVRRRRRRRDARQRHRVPHRTRRGFSSGPVHVTLRIRDDAPYLRKLVLYALIRRCMVRSGRKPYFRICHYSIQSNHLHMICEADSQLALSRGIQGFASAMARRINKHIGRSGTFFSERYHMHALRTPSEVRNAVCYVVNNWRKHRLDRGKDWATDPYSSGELFGPWFTGTRPRWLLPGELDPIVPPRTWLLRDGWQRVGTISPFDVPGATDRAPA
jgi:putative transposase